MKIELLEDAQQDLINGFRFYERQSPGLGNRFLDTVFSEMDSLRFRAETLGREYGFFRLHTERFPFAVYYLFEGDGIRISAVLDRRRGPRLVSEDRVRRGEKVSFRAIRLSFDHLASLRAALPGIVVEYRQHKVKGTWQDDFGVWVDLVSPAVCEALRQALSANPIDVFHSVYVSLFSLSCSDGVVLPPFVLDFLRSVDCGMEFSFTTCSDSTVTMGSIHHRHLAEENDYTDQQVTFRALGMASKDASTLRASLADVSAKSRKCRGRDEYAVSVELTSPDVCKRLAEVLSANPPRGPYGVHVHFVTEWTWPVFDVEPFVCELIRAVGGTVELSFSVVEEEE